MGYGSSMLKLTAMIRGLRMTKSELENKIFELNKEHKIEMAKIARRKKTNDIRLKQLNTYRRDLKQIISRETNASKQKTYPQDRLIWVYETFSKEEIETLISSIKGLDTFPIICDLADKDILKHITLNINRSNITKIINGVWVENYVEHLAKKTISSISSVASPQ